MKANFYYDEFDLDRRRKVFHEYKKHIKRISISRMKLKKDKNFIQVAFKSLMISILISYRTTSYLLKILF